MIETQLLVCLIEAKIDVYDAYLECNRAIEAIPIAECILDQYESLDSAISNLYDIYTENTSRMESLKIYPWYDKFIGIIKDVI